MEIPSFIGSFYGMLAVLIFLVAYGLVIYEEKLHLRKSKPVMLAAGLIWVLAAFAYNAAGKTEALQELFNHNLLEYGQLLLFLLAAMTYINTLEESNLFKALRAWLVSKGFSLYWIFWITGILAFFISSIADNLTTALLMSAVVMAVAPDRPQYLVMSCINLVVAANAGGAFCPFGDITTLMVWQSGVVKFWQFFDLFIPAFVNWFVPALIMSFFIDKGQPAALTSAVEIKRGGLVILGLFILTIALAVAMHNSLHLPPVLGMMTGLSLLKLYGWYLKKTDGIPENDIEDSEIGQFNAFNIFTQLQRAEWDTLLFFYGVIMCVGGLGALGYLAALSDIIYTGLGPVWAGILVGIVSAIIDNIPVMFAVLTMHPDMGLDDWLLVTLTAGVGGSLLSIGSAAGVALMGQARGIYTFNAHLKWSGAIFLGYVLSIIVHLWIN